MKKIVVFVCLLLAMGVTQAQVDRSKAPLPGPAREIKIGDYQTFTLKNGLQVFVVENRKLPRIQISLQLKNDPVYQGEKEGYVEMAGTLLGTGTTSRSKAKLDEEVDFIGATLNTSSSGIFASSLSKHSSKLVELMADVLYNPSFAPEELEKLKTQTLSALAASKDDPNSIATNVRSAVVYGKQHPYGLFTTEKSVSAITMEDIKAYYHTYFKPNNAFLIIVGDIDLKTAKSLSEKHFSKWAKGEVKTQTYPQPKEPAKTYVALVDRPASVQSVINIGYAVDLKPGPPDAITARVLNQILGGGFSSRLMQNLREKNAFTYGARSSLSADILVGNFNASASVRNEVTDSAVHEFMAELRRIVNESVTEKELLAAKAEIAGSFGRSLENPQTIAGFALSTAKYNLPKDYYNNYLKAVEAVTLADVQAAAKKYIRPENAHIVIVGKAAEVADKLKAFGEVKYFDMNGGPTTAPAKAVALPEGLTAEKVIADYLQAIGGEKKLKELKSLAYSMKGTVQGMEVTLNVSKKAPNKFLIETVVMGNVMNAQKGDGKNVSVSQQGQKIAVEGANKEQALFEGSITPELNLAAYHVKATVTAIENVNGKEAYIVECVMPGGNKTFEYFDVATGLKVKSTKEADTPQGKMTIPTEIGDYKEVNGIKIPHTLVQSMGPMKIKFEISTVTVNPTLDDSLFKVE